MPENSFLQLSEDLIPILLEYLDGDDNEQFLLINTTFAHRFLKSIRRIRNKRMTKLLLQTNYQQEQEQEHFSSLIKDPYHQLDIKIDEKEMRTLQDLQEYALIVHHLEASGRIKRILPYLHYYCHRNLLFFHRIQELSITIDQFENTSWQRRHSFLQHLSMRNDTTRTEQPLGLFHLRVFQSDFLESAFDNDGDDDDGADSGDDNDDDEHEDDDGVEEKDEEWQGVEDASLFPFIPNLLSLTLVELSISAIPSQYCNLQKLLLIGCEMIEDVSALGHIYDLTLRECPSVTDISSLQNNHKITIQNCGGILDYSKSFENSVVIIIDRGLYGELFSSSLLCWKCVQSLHVRGLIFDSVLKFPSSLRFFQIDHLGKSGLFEVMNLVFLRHLSLQNSDTIHSVEQFGHIQILELISLKKLSSLNGLGKGNRKVLLQECDQIKDFSPLRFIETIHILDCKRFKNLSEIDQVQNLTLQFFLYSPLKDLRPLGNHVKHLSLIWSSERAFLTKGFDLIPVIEIEFLPDDCFSFLPSFLQSQHHHQKIILHFQYFAHHLFPIHPLYIRSIFMKKKTVVYLRK